MPIEDVMQGHHERAAVRAPEAAQAHERPTVLAPAAPVPLEDGHLRGGKLATDLVKTVGLLVDATGIDLEDLRARLGGSCVGDELPVATDPALRPPQVQEADAPQAGGHGQPV